MLMAGRYECNFEIKVIADNIRIQGAGAQKTTIVLFDSKYNSFENINSKNVTISDLKFEGTERNLRPQGNAKINKIALRNENNVMNNVEFTNCQLAISGNSNQLIDIHFSSTTVIMIYDYKLLVYLYQNH